MTPFREGSKQLEYWFVSSSFASGAPPQQNNQQPAQQIATIDLYQQEITFTIYFLYRYGTNAVAENIAVV